MITYLRAVWLTMTACVQYVRYKTDDDEFYADINRARAMVGKPLLIWCDKHHWQEAHTVPGVANEPTCFKCV